MGARMCTQLQLMTKEAMNVMERYMREFGGSRGRGKLCNHITISKINRTQKLKNNLQLNCLTLK